MELFSIRIQRTFQLVSTSCIKDWCINYNLDMVSGRYVTEKTYDEQYGHELVIQ